MIPVGNRLTSSLQPTNSVYDDANRLTENSDYTYTYDDNGNLTSKTDKSTNETTTYTYDAENQLTQVSKPGMTVTYRYDGFGRRIGKDANGTIRRYVYDWDHVIWETDGNNNFVATNRWGPGVDNYLMRSHAGGFNYIYMEDGLGSITEVTNWHGNVRRAYVYDSFGNTATQTGTLNPTNPFKYTGRELEEETGLYYYRARFYDPEIGRFINEDPIGFEGDGLNLYAYVKNNPINRTDPFGEFSLPVHGNFCGPGHGDISRNAPEPIDKLDGCCKGHDECINDTCGCTHSIICTLQGKTTECDDEMCRCIRKNVKISFGNYFKIIIIDFFLCRGSLTPFPP